MAAPQRRSAQDLKWTQLRNRVHKRDKNRCRACGCLSLTESKIAVPPTEKRLDCAHVYAASSYPSVLYCDENVYLLCRTMHRRMDNFQDLVTAEPIEVNKHFYWWWRIIQNKVFDYDEHVDYENLVRSLIQPIR